MKDKIINLVDKAGAFALRFIIPVFNFIFWVIAFLTVLALGKTLIFG